jgi:hypothetical protein
MTMRMLLAQLALALLFSGQARASACIEGHPAPGQEFQLSMHVVEAVVVSINRDVPVSFTYQGKSYQDLVDRVTIRVLRSYKKPTNKLVTFDNPQTSAAMPLSLNGSYLFFLRRNSPSENLYVDTCGSSGPLGETSPQTLAAVRNQSSHRRER